MLTLALAGKPNAGKSTFYSAATRAEVDVANYPFTTIDPNCGVSYVRTECPCLAREERCGNENCRDGKRYVPVELIDVAGLVPGAHEGRGLGNQFLDALTNADAIITVVDASGGTNAEGERVDIGSYDPVEEIDFVEEEMDRWLAGIVERNWEGVERQSRSPGFDIDEAITDVLTGFGTNEADVAIVLRELEYPENPREWTDEDREELARLVRARTKPILVAANKADIAPAENLERLREAGESAEPRSAENSSGQRPRERAGRHVVPTTAEGELALRKGAEAGLIAYDPGDLDFDVLGELSDAQRTKLEELRGTMNEYGGTGVQAALDGAVYNLLDRFTAYPVQNETKWTDGQGNVLPDAFLLPAGSTPKDLAYAVHSDIGEGYLHAVDARSNRRIGEGHELEEGDVIKIVSTAT